MSTQVINMERYASDITVDSGHIDGSSRKRVKIGEVDVKEFQPGSIIKIRLENFVTYELTEFNLSPSLNMIIGPNGSGKSTFVCAVCLGLAGRPEYIGRSKKVEDFIKNGQDRSVIEIILKNSDRVEGISEVHLDTKTIKITRVIMRQKKKSDYMINDRSVPESTVKKLISQINIQLDNLCQFLSQERVEEFARLKSDKLLVETVRSIDPKLLETLDLLKDLQTEEIDTQKDVQVKTQRLEELKSEKEKLEDSVRAFKEFEKKKNEVEIHTQLLPYVKVKDHKEKLQTFRRDYEEAKKQLKSLLKDKKPFSDAKKSLVRNVEDTDVKREAKEEEFKKAKMKVKKLFDELGTIKDDIIKKKNQNDYYKGRTKKLRTAIEETKQDIKEKQESLDQIELPDPNIFDELTSQRNNLIRQEAEINDRLLEINSKASAISHEMKTIQGQAETRSRSLNTSDRIGVLDQNDDLRDVKDAVQYIRSKPEMMSKVLEPPIMAVSVTNPRMAPYLAQCVDYNTCKAFTIIDSQTYELFSNDILKQFKVNLRELTYTDLTPPMPIDELKSLGFDGYLSDFVTGDSRVINMLSQFSKIHMIPVSVRQLSPDQLKALTVPNYKGEIKFKRIIHGNRIVDIKRSSYGAKQIFSVDSNIKDTKFYQVSTMSVEQSSRIKSDIQLLKNKYKEKQVVLDNLSREKNDEKSKRSNITSESDILGKKAYYMNEIRKNHSMAKVVIDSLETKLNQLRHEAKKDVTQKIKEVEAQISKQLNRESELVRSMVSIMNDVNQCQKELVTSEIYYFEAYNLDISMNDVIGFFNEREEELKKEYESKKQFIKEMRDTPEFQSWMQQIRSYNEQTRETLNDYAEKYESESNFTLKFIKNTIAKLESEISMLNNDESAIIIMGQVKKELESLDLVLPQQVGKLNTIREQVYSNRTELEPILDEIVQNISKSFARLFINVGSAGTVNLEKPHLFSDWKIKIMVKFRDVSQLKQLDSHTQSGGERAVSTVLYMIALQEFTTAPFRVVDEINQGMDPRNERIVHKAMVENACAENTSQYFLITPKLLTNLYYHENMRIHCVMAGSWIPSPIEKPEMVHFGQTSNYVF